MTLDEAKRRLSTHQLVAIGAAAHHASGTEHIDDLAYIDALLVELLANYNGGPVEFCVAAARKALLAAAHTEDLIRFPPGTGT